MRTAPVPALAGASRRASDGKRLGRNVRAFPMLYLMVLPVVAYFVLFKYLPMLGTIIAFQNFRPARGFLNRSFVGLKHFRDFLLGPYAARTIRNTIELNLLQLLFGFPAPILLALLLNELRPNLYKKGVQTVTYLPYFISLVVVCGIVKDFSSTTGLFGDIAAFFGLERLNLLTELRYYRTVYVASSLWQSVGWGSILYLATLSNADPQLFEAAVVDGANRFQQVWHVTLPALLPVIIVQLILRIGHLMSVGADRTILLYTPVVYEKADIISSFVYRYGLQNINYSYGSAVDLFNSAINLLLLVSANRFSAWLTDESLW